MIYAISFDNFRVHLSGNFMIAVRKINVIFASFEHKYRIYFPPSETFAIDQCQIYF